MKGNFTFTIPFDHKPSTLPAGAQWGYIGHGRNGPFKAAGFQLHFYPDYPELAGAKVDLSNLTSRGETAKHTVTLPPQVMDRVALRWLIQRSYRFRKIIADSLKDMSVQTEVDYIPACGARIPARSRGTVKDANPGINDQDVYVYVTFDTPDAGIIVSALELLDPAKFYLAS